MQINCSNKLTVHTFSQVWQLQFRCGGEVRKPFFSTVLTGARHFLLAYRFNFCSNNQTESADITFQRQPWVPSTHHNNLTPAHLIFQHRWLQHVKICDSRELAKIRDTEFSTPFFASFYFWPWYVYCALVFGPKLSTLQRGWKLN